MNPITVSPVEHEESCGDREHYSNILCFGMCPACKHLFSLPVEKEPTQ